MSGSETEILGNLFKYYIFCFILLFTSSSPCLNDQFAVSYFSWIFLLGINFCYFQKVPDKSLLIFSFLLGKCNGNTYFQTIQRCAYSLPRRRYKGTGKGEFGRTGEKVKRKFSSSLLPRARSRALIPFPFPFQRPPCRLVCVPYVKQITERNRQVVVELTLFLYTVFLCSEFKLVNIYSGVNFWRKMSEVFF